VTISSCNVTDENPAAQRQYPITGNVRPLNDRLVVRRISDLCETGAYAVVIPDCARKPSKMGVVVSVGPGKRQRDGSRCALDVRVGQVILFGRYTDYDDGELLLIQEADVVGVVSDGGTE
jgi:chaperonin GroES